MRLFEILASWSEKRPWFVVIGVAAVTVFMAFGTARITTELSQESMMPKGYESIEALETVDDEFGGISYEYGLIVVEKGSGDIQDVTSPSWPRRSPP